MNKQSLSVLTLMLGACGGDPTAIPATPTALPAYVAPQDRIEPPATRSWDLEAFRALGVARSGPANLRGVLSTSAQRYVATTGDDAADGSQEAPWRPVQHAADSVAPDTTVWVEAGTYEGGLHISKGGEPGAYIIFRPWGAHSPRLVGGPSFDAVVHIEASYVVLAGFEISDHNRGQSDSADSIGVQVEPADADLTNIQILHNWVHDIGPGVVDQAACYYNGHGIIAQAEGHLIQNLIVRGNELSNLYVGHSECLVLNGHIDGFEVSQNYVHDVNNIGIDIIGYEKNSRETTKNGLVADNVVLDASNYWPYCSRGNCAYPAGDESSDGIYVDGGADMVIEYNVVGRADHGIELQSENGQLIRNVEVRFNSVFNSHYKNFTLGDHEGSSERNNEFFDRPELNDGAFEGCRGS